MGGSMNASQVTVAGLLREKQILGDAKKGIPPLIPVSRMTWWRGVRDGRYPQPVRLGPNTVAWRASEIHALIDHGTKAV